MCDGALPQSKLATSRDFLTDTGGQILFRRNFLNRDSDVGQSAGCWLDAAECLTPILLQENSASQPDKGMQPQALPASGLRTSGCDSEALGFPRAGEVAPAQIMQHLPSITTPRDV